MSETKLPAIREIRSETPRTDYHIMSNASSDPLTALLAALTFAKTLERELDACRTALRGSAPYGDPDRPAKYNRPKEDL